MATIGYAASGDILIRHLGNFAALHADEKAAIGVATSTPARSVKPRRDLIREGERPEGVILILSGWACRYRILEDGRRQIVAFLIPGDMCDLHNTVLARMDHSIGAITHVRYAAVPNALLDQMSSEHPRIGKALWWQMLVGVATQREWTMNIGQRNAAERIGSLFCELLTRLRAVGLADGVTHSVTHSVTDGVTFDFPLSQIDIAEATGLTPVHVNRTVQALRAAGLIVWTGKVLTIPDVAKLQLVSLFAPDYLHLDEEKMRGDGSDRSGAGK